MRVNAKLQLGLGSKFNPNNLLTVTLTTNLTLTLNLNPNLPNEIMTRSELFGKTNFAAGVYMIVHTVSCLSLLRMIQ